MRRLGNNAVLSFRGFIVQIVANYRVVYSEGWREIPIDVETALCPTRMLVYAQTITQWRFGFSSQIKLWRISPAKKRQVLDRVHRALETLSLPHEIVS